MEYPYTMHSTAAGRAATPEDVYSQAADMITSSASLSQLPPAPDPAPPRESVIGDDFNGNQLQPSPLSRTNVTTNICRANKKQKIDCSDQNNNIAESAVQSVRLVHEEDSRMDLNDQVAYIVKVFLDDDIDIDDGHDNISDCAVDNNVDNEDSSSASSDGKAVIERMKAKSKIRAVATATATATTRSIVE